MDELDKVLGEKGKETPKDPIEKKEPEKKDPKELEIEQREQHLANLDKAIAEKNEELRLKRKAAKKESDDDEDEDEPEIDFKDPSAKAWGKHINKSIDPVTKELEAEKQEIFKFAFKAFAGDKPALLASPEKMKQLITTYERIKDNTGRTEQGILNDLRRAYAAENADSILEDRSRGRVVQARKDAVYADAGISRGASNYQQDREIDPVYDDQDAAILAKWGMTPQEHAKLKKEQDEKAAKAE